MRLLIEIVDLSYSYGNLIALENISFGVKKGEFIGVVGPNGGGKSTLIKLLAGIIPIQSGTINISTDKIGFVPQNTSFSSSFPISAIDVVKMGFLNSKTDEAEAVNALEKVGAGEYIHKKIGELSGGQRQRVFIARALVGGSELLLLDEPTASVDPAGSKEIYKLLKSIGLTVVLVSHDLLDLVGVADKIASINKRLIHFDRLKNGSKELCCEVDLLEHFLECHE